MYHMKARTATIVLILLSFLFALLTGCKGQPTAFNGIEFQALGEPHPENMIAVDNEWLQKKSTEAAKGLDLYNGTDFSEYLETINSTIERYFERYAKLTEIIHYSDDYWGLQYSVSSEHSVMGYAGLLYAVDPHSGMLLVWFE